MNTDPTLLKLGTTNVKRSNLIVNIANSNFNDLSTDLCKNVFYWWKK